MSMATAGERDPRAVIVVGTDEHVVVDEAIAALRGVSDLYQRNGKLVRVRWTDPPPQALQKRSLHIEPIPSADLRGLLSQRVRFISHDDNGREWEGHVPHWVVPQLEARSEWPGIRFLSGVIHEPCLRRDGSVLDNPGYDAATGLLYEPSRDAVRVDPFPTREDAIASAHNLLEIVRDFPFAEPAHQAAWLAALLTPFTRFAFADAAPLFLIDANVAGTGKSTLADVIGLIATGRDMPRNVYPQSDEEMRKLITSIAISATRVTLFDNVPGSLGCASLDAALTGTTWRDRMLGKNSLAEVSLHAIWYATGNNIMLNADTGRRTLHIRLQSQYEHPEERGDFTHPDLRRWVGNKRESFVRDCLTILRAYYVAGCPVVPMEEFGSFEEWSKRVRAPIIWCGLPDPAQTRRGLATNADPERELIRQAVLAIDALDPQGTGFTVGEILDKLKLPANQTARSVLVQWVGRADAEGIPMARSFGMKLAKIRERIVAGRQLVRNGERWLVRKVGADATTGTTGSRSGSSGSSPAEEAP